MDEVIEDGAAKRLCFVTLAVNQTIVFLAMPERNSPARIRGHAILLWQPSIDSAP
jgi:hypothetical protein